MAMSTVEYEDPKKPKVWGTLQGVLVEIRGGLKYQSLEVWQADGTKVTFHNVDHITLGRD